MDLYRHYNGAYYVVVAEAKHSETQEELIVYREANGSQTWVRPRAMFFQLLTLADGSVVSRFKLVDKDRFCFLCWTEGHATIKCDRL